MGISYLYNEKTKTIHIRGYCPSTAGTTYGKTYLSLEEMMRASGGKAVMCRKCLRKKELLEAEIVKARKKELQAELARKKEAERKLKEEEQRKREEAKRILEEEEERKREEAKRILEEEEQRKREEEQRIRAAEWEEKLQKRRKNRETAWMFVVAGIILFVLGVAVICSSYETAILIFGCIAFFVGFFAVLCGFVYLHDHPDNGQDGPLQKPVKMSAADQAVLYKVQVAQNMPPEKRSQMLAQASAQYSADLNSEWQAKKTKKEMIKGAVVGGIVGGDAGAVVGAMIAKEKSEK